MLAYWTEELFWAIIRQTGVEIKVSKKNELIEETLKVIKQYTIRLTLRQIFYRLVAGEVIPNTKYEYKYLSSCLVFARLEGAIPFDAIEDRIRSAAWINDYIWTAESYFKTQLEEYKTFKDSWQNFNFPRWKDQPKLVEVWLEKDLAHIVLLIYIMRQS